MLKHGILGLLAYGDMSGYEIKRVFEDSLNYFWGAQTSQIYRELGLLERQGWIRRQMVPQSGRPDKNLCSITSEGRAELNRWLAEPAVDQEPHNGTLMKTFFMGRLPRQRSRAFFQALRDQYQLELNRLARVDESFDRYRSVASEQDALFWAMTLDYGRRNLQLSLEWAENCLRLLETSDEPAELGAGDQ